MGAHTAVIHDLKNKKGQENRRRINPYTQQLDDPGRSKTAVLDAVPVWKFEGS